MNGFVEQGLLSDIGGEVGRNRWPLQPLDTVFNIVFDVGKPESCNSWSGLFHLVD